MNLGSKDHTLSESATILLVEDDDQLRSLLREVLRAAGYQVLDARLNSQAALLCGRHRGPIDLLIADVVMPGTTGAQLARRLRAWRPDMKLLFMSGSPKEVLDRDGVLERDARFLQKPFDGSRFLTAVRAVLAEPAPTPPAALRGLSEADLLQQLALMQTTLQQLADTVARIPLPAPPKPAHHRRVLRPRRHRRRAWLRPEEP